MLTLNLSGVNQEIWNQFYLYTKQGSRNELVSIIPQGFTSPIYLRRSTSDINNFIQIYLQKEYEFLPEQPNTILDLGGYIGLASTYLAHKYPNARIALVEPDPDNYIIAKLNSRQFGNIECINVGVWSKTCDLTISAKVGGDWGTMVREVSEGEEVSPKIKAMSVIDIMNFANMEHIDFLKIDIEGSEKEIFSHSYSKEWIRKSKVISCELHDRMVEGCSDAFHNAINGEGFTHGKHGEFDFYIKNGNTLNDNSLEQNCLTF
jgi:FkbM family methyltransferase